MEFEAFQRHSGMQGPQALQAFVHYKQTGRYSADQTQRGADAGVEGRWGRGVTGM
jgi:hypothetical protein